jgi:hypothetical protein
MKLSNLTARRSKLYRILAVAMTIGLLSSVFAGSALANTASSPVSDVGVTPYIIDGANPGGNITCEEVGLAFFDDAGYYEFSSDRVNYEGGAFDAAFPNGLTVTTGGTYVSFSSAFGIGAVIVKGSNDANVYVYDPQVTSDSGLASPTNASGNPAGLSNITFCWNADPVGDEWCSPGYWRQPHHLGSWVATGYAPSDSFEDAIGYYPTLSKQGERQNAPTDPTLLQVLENPQWYGGDAFNAVGDLLSAAHPDVNFKGERVEDSCPLN